MASLPSGNESEQTLGGSQDRAGWHVAVRGVTENQTRLVAEQQQMERTAEIRDILVLFLTLWKCL